MNHSIRRATASASLLLLASFAGAAWARDPVPVDVARVDAAASTEALSLSGSLLAERSAGLSPRIDGLVAGVAVDAGDRVSAGQVLLTLDDAQARLALARLEAEVARARALRDEAARRVTEAEPLVARRSFPETELAARRAALALADADLRAATAAEREQLELVERHRLRAPFAGVIARRAAEAGEWVVRGTPVLQLVDLSAIRLEVQAPQERFADLSPDVAVTIEPDVALGTRVPARITARVPVAGDATTRSFLLRVVADDPPLALLPGTSARAHFQITRSSAALVVPRDALLRHPDGGYSVFVVVGDGANATARRRPLSIGREYPDRVEVGVGVVAGERVVVRGNEGLEDGQPVVVRVGAQSDGP
jgi:RND family efflux transporter MFP subunit